MVAKMLTMYETDRPSTLINDTRWLLHFRSWSRVRSAMPNRELMRNGERNLEFFSSSFWPWKRVGKRGKRRILPKAGNRSVPTASFSSAYFTQERWLKVFHSSVPDFRIFNLWNFQRLFAQLYGHLPCEHVASTGKQSDPTLRLVMIPRGRKTRWLERVGHRPACAHGDTACVRILTESDIKFSPDIDPIRPD